MKFTSSFVALLLTVGVYCAPSALPEPDRTALNAQIKAGTPLKHVTPNPRPKGNSIINTSERMQGDANSLQRGMTNRVKDTVRSNSASMAKQNQLVRGGDVNGAIREAQNQVTHNTFQKAHTAVDRAQKGALEAASSMAKARGD
jgi:hypothetical protein